MAPAIRFARPDDIAGITRIYAHAVRYGTASFELEAPDEDEMARRMAAIDDGAIWPPSSTVASNAVTIRHVRQFLTVVPFRRAAGSGPMARQVNQMAGCWCHVRVRIQTLLKTGY